MADTCWRSFSTAAVLWDATSCHNAAPLSHSLSLTLSHSLSRQVPPVPQNQRRDVVTALVATEPSLAAGTWHHCLRGCCALVLCAPEEAPPDSRADAVRTHTLVVAAAAAMRHSLVRPRAPLPDGCGRVRSSWVHTRAAGSPASGLILRKDTL
jgi:hypothetical protein